MNNRTDSIQDAARQVAEDALADQALRVSTKVYADFLARLDEPAAANSRLKQTLQTSAPWDQA